MTYVPRDEPAERIASFLLSKSNAAFVRRVAQERNLTPHGVLTLFIEETCRRRRARERR